MEEYDIFTDTAGNRFMTIANDENTSAKYSKSSDSGVFIKGKLYGRGEIKYKNGNLYVGFLKGLKRDGYGEMVYNEPETEKLEDLGVYKGYWKRNNRTGEGLFIFSLIKF